MGKTFACLAQGPGLLGKPSFSMTYGMAATRSVTVEGGGANLYEISEYRGRYTASHVRVGLLSNSRTSIGTGGSLEDALSLIRVHSGKQIKNID